jgi:hypothetical protein
VEGSRAYEGLSNTLEKESSGASTPLADNTPENTPRGLKEPKTCGPGALKESREEEVLRNDQVNLGDQ